MLKRTCPWPGTDADSNAAQPRAQPASCLLWTRWLEHAPERLRRVHGSASQRPVVGAERPQHEVLRGERLRRRLDPVRVRTREAEALVVRRVALDQQQRLTALLRDPNRLVHQRAPDAATLMGRQHRQRPDL